jgi:hypothetical protein
MARMKKPKDDTEARQQDWQTQVDAMKLAHSAFEGQVAVQQETLKSISQFGQQWGLDLPKLTQMSKDAFEKMGREVQAQFEQRHSEPSQEKASGKGGKK